VAADAAAAVGLTISERQAQQLLDYLALLQRWNATYNLTAIRDPSAMWTHHVLDCLSALPSVARHLAAVEAPSILDVGSGGGLPGLVWAILKPDVSITCLDTVGKKAAFMRQAAGHLSLDRVTIAHARVERFDHAPFNLITSRAFASLADFTSQTRHLLAPNGCWAAMKGRPPDAEISELPHGVTMFHVEQLAVPDLNAERCLIWLKMQPNLPAETPPHPAQKLN
jgi:16S rRNA (guanine527-N7)-methyltransferase